MPLKLNFKTNMINWIRTVKLRRISIATIVVTIAFISDLNFVLPQKITDIYALVPEDTRVLITKLFNYSNILKILLPKKFARNGLYFITIIFWIAVFYFRFCCKEDKEFKKRLIHIIGHSTLGKCQYKLDEKLNNTIKLDVRELDLIEQMKSIKTNLSQLNYLVNTQDIFIENFMSSVNSKDHYGYMGIAHTPLILRAGYKTGDETSFIIFHKKRNKDYFEELNESEIYTPIKIEKKEIKQDSQELVVAISTTFPIEDKSLSALNYKEKSIIKFKTDDLGFDVIISNKQIEQYINTILHNVRQIVRDYDIRKIHMVISSSVAFSFALGQRLSSNYDSETIVYHYDNNDEKKYPWGISLFKDYSNCVVETEALKHNV